MPPNRITAILKDERGITGDTAIRLGLYFNMEARFWLNLQSEYDARIAERDLLPAIKQRIRPLNLNAA